MPIVAVALALRRNGHRVYGLVRDPVKGLNLAKHEITPVIGDILQPSSWTFVIESEGIDVVIDSSNVHQNMSKVLTEAKRLGEARLKGLKRGPKLGFILLSGSWVHGDQPDARDIVNELTAPTPFEMVAWRPAVENELLSSSDVLDAVVIRPTMFYGGSGSIFSMLLAPIAAAVKGGASEVRVLGRKIELPVIHKDDVADFTLKVVERVGSSLFFIFLFFQSERFLTLCRYRMWRLCLTLSLISQLNTNPTRISLRLQRSIWGSRELSFIGIRKALWQRLSTRFSPSSTLAVTGLGLIWGGSRGIGTSWGRLMFILLL